VIHDHSVHDHSGHPFESFLGCHDSSFLICSNAHRIFNISMAPSRLT
jgi:hypothetical protein